MRNLVFTVILFRKLKGEEAENMSEFFKEVDEEDLSTKGAEKGKKKTSFFTDDENETFDDSEALERWF